MNCKKLIFTGFMLGILGYLFTFDCQKFDIVYAQSALHSNQNLTNAKKTASGSSLDAAKEDIAVWKYNKNTKCLTISGKGRLYDPEKVSEYSDNNWKWGFEAPGYSKKVKTILIEPGVTRIDTGTFSDFESLESISIPETVTTIEDYAFYRCKKLKEITIPDSVTKIGQECFWECTSLKKITLGKNVQEIGDRIFYRCNKLNNIILHTENKYLKIQDKILYSQDGKTLYYSLLDGNSTVHVLSGTEIISSCAFANNTNIKKLVIPATVKTIEGGAFYQCIHLKKITFEEDSQCVSLLDYSYYNDGYEDNFGVFQGCEKIKIIKLPDSVQYLGCYTFNGCKALKEIYFGKNFIGFSWYGTVEEIEKDADKYTVITQYTTYKNTSLNKYTVSKMNANFISKNGVIYNKNQTELIMYPPCKKESSVTIPKGIKRIGASAFCNNKNIQYVSLSQSMEEIGERAFYCCSNLKKITWTDKLKWIGESAFWNCVKLERVSVTAKDAVIGDFAFSGCKSVKSIFLGKGIKKIGQNAFYHCIKIKRITIPATVKKIDFLAFGYYHKKTKNYDGDKKIKGFIIYGKKGSAAQRYAKNNKIKFIW